MALRVLRRSALAAASSHASACAVAGASLGRRGSKNLDWYYNAIQDLGEAATAVDPPAFPEETLHGRKRARAFFDLQFGKDQSNEAAPVSRVVFELADDLVPVTVQNFLALCERPAGQGYRGSELFHVRKGFGITGGDWISGDGRGGRSSFPDGRPFADENFIVRHSVPGVLTMANTGVHSNTSVFFITLAKAKHLDGRNVAFGRVLTGLDVLTKLGSAFTVNFKPATPVYIKDAGVLPEKEWEAVDKAVAAAVKAAGAKAAAAAKPKA